MHIRVLGAFEVVRNEVVLTPSAPKLRRVFALLAINANRVVRIDQIIEELWEDRPPLSATTTLQTYIYQLRKPLGWPARENGAPSFPDSSPVNLRTIFGGYMLHLPDGALDAHQFERLATEGRAKLDAGDLDAAPRILRQALKLWRGPAFTAVSTGPLLQAEALRLDELRKIVVGHQIDAELQLGRHAELIGELAMLVAQEPTHEGFQAKLMLTLYRSGRRSEALRVYQRARAALARELGLEPSAELQRLHSAVLSADPALDAPVRWVDTVRATRAAEPPNQLPSDLPPLIGRSEPLAAVRDALATAQRAAPLAVLAVGAPGVGKSAFVVSAAHQVRASYPGGIFYASLLTPKGEPVPPVDVLASFLTTVGLPLCRESVSLQDLRRLFRSWTASRKVLVVLDDAVDIKQLEPLLPSGPGCATLVAGRRLLSHPAIGLTVPLRPLAAEEARRMLSDVVGRHRLAGDAEAVREVLELCDGLPLALRAAANVLQLRPHWRIDRLLARMRGERRRPADLCTEEVSVADSVELTYRLLSAADQAVFRIVGGSAVEPVSPLDAAAILGIDEGEAEALLEDLVEFQLAEVTDVGVGDSFRYQFLPLFRGVAMRLETRETRAPTR